MQREFPRIRLVRWGTAAALAALAVGLAGCGGSPGAGTSGGSASRGSTGSARQASSGNGSLATSHLKVLTKLKRAQLCGVLTISDAAKILGATTAAPAYARRLGLGITCEWIRKGAGQLSPDELYIGISTVVDWTGARAVDKLLHPSSVTIHGHPALTADKQSKIDWAQVDVALGGDHDPVAEYRAPTMASALALARAATPRIVAMG